MKIVLLLLLLTNVAHSSIKLNVVMVHKKGIDKGLILVSELHQVEIIGGTESVSFLMKGGVRLEAEANFLEDFSLYGPCDTLELRGKIYSASGKKIGELEGDSSRMQLGKEKLFVFTEEDQLIEIRILPEISK